MLCTARALYITVSMNFFSRIRSRAILQAMIVLVGLSLSLCAIAFFYLIIIGKQNLEDDLSKVSIFSSRCKSPLKATLAIPL